MKCLFAYFIELIFRERAIDYQLAKESGAISDTE